MMYTHNILQIVKLISIVNFVSTGFLVLKLDETSTFPINFQNQTILLESFQSYHNDNNNLSSMILVTKSNKYILICDKYEVDSVMTESYYEAKDPIIGGYIYGIWIFYSEPNFNWDLETNKRIPETNVEWIFSTNPHKFYTFGLNVSSFRTPAGPITFSEPSFTVFLGHNFTGPSDIENDTIYQNPPFSKPKSLIITGANPWYVYTASNFVQKTLCIVPTNQHILIGDFYAQQITKLLRHINSAHIDGCTVEFLNATTAKITDVKNEEGQDVVIRRIPPIFMRNEDDENLVNYLT